MVSKNGTHSVKNRTEKRTKLKLTNCKVDKLTSIWVNKLAGIDHLVALVMLGILALNAQLCHALKKPQTHKQLAMNCLPTHKSYTNMQATTSCLPNHVGMPYGCPRGLRMQAKAAKLRFGKAKATQTRKLKASTTPLTRT